MSTILRKPNGQLSVTIDKTITLDKKNLIIDAIKQFYTVLPYNKKYTFIEFYQLINKIYDNEKVKNLSSNLLSY